MGDDGFGYRNINQQSQVNAQETGRAGARARCKVYAQTQVRINAKKRNFTVFCLALCLAEKTKGLALFH
jgi:hypothetical protein